MDAIRMQRIKDTYNNMETIGQLDIWISRLTEDEKQKLHDAMYIVSSFCGMDMRLELVRRALKSNINNRG